MFGEKDAAEFEKFFGWVKEDVEDGFAVCDAEPDAFVTNGPSRASIRGSPIVNARPAGFDADALRTSLGRACRYRLRD